MKLRSRHFAVLYRTNLKSACSTRGNKTYNRHACTLHRPHFTHSGNDADLEYSVMLDKISVQVNMWMFLTNKTDPKIVSDKSNPAIRQRSVDGNLLDTSFISQSGLDLWHFERLSSLNTRIQGFPAKSGDISRWSVLFCSTVSGVIVVAGWCASNGPYFYQTNMSLKKQNRTDHICLACWSVCVHILQTVWTVCYCTLCILLIENSVGVHGVVPGRKILQVNHDNFAYFRTQRGPQEAQPGRSGGLAGVRGICKLTEHCFLVDSADSLSPSLQEHRSLSVTQVERQKRWL